jgi:hypothetical protein
MYADFSFLVDTLALICFAGRLRWSRRLRCTANTRRDDGFDRLLMVFSSLISSSTRNGKVLMRID